MYVTYDHKKNNAPAKNKRRGKYPETVPMKMQQKKPEQHVYNI